MEATELKHVLAGDTLRYAGADVPSGLYKIRIPAGTKAWRLVVQTYRSDEVALASLSMDAPPVAARSTPVGPDTRNTLQRLWSGETLRCESPANSGTISVSQPEMGGAWRAERERWLYLDVVFPGGRTLAWQSQAVLDEAYVPAPPDNAEAHTLALVKQAGLVPALNTFGACTSDQDLIDRAVSSGVWAGLMELVRIAEKG